MKTRFKVLRYNPERDAKPHYKTFALEVSRGMTLLEALRTLKEEQDGSLAFRWSCESSICGSCAVTVNGVNMLACETQVEALKKKADCCGALGLPTSNLSTAKVITECLHRHCQL